MQITQQFSWSAVSWPQNAPATQYAVFQVYPLPASSTPISTVTGTSTTVTYDDTTAVIFQARPTDGSTYGPICATMVNGDVYCRAWLRQKIRYALADQQQQAGVTSNWSDDEINKYIQEALNELSIRFPVEKDTVIPLLGPTVDPMGNPTGTRDYVLPSNCYQVLTVLFVTQGGKLQLYLKEKPFRGGESTATSYIGYPKLGILLSPLQGRYYPGHYDVYEGALHIDWDPAGNDDYLRVRYVARYAVLTDDAQLMTDLFPEDMELVSLRAQMKCWLRVEGQDTRLSRWRETGKRDDMPTVRMSNTIKQLYNELMNDRRELRPKVRRLVRR